MNGRGPAPVFKPSIKLVKKAAKTTANPEDKTAA